MNSKVLYFAGGVVVGAAATYLVMRKKMASQIDEEVQSVKELYSAMYSHQKDENDSSDEFDDEKESPEEAVKRNNQMKKDIFDSFSIILDKNYLEKHQVENYNLFSKPPKPSDIDNGIDEDEELDILDTTPPPYAEGPYVLETDKWSTAAEKFVNEEPYFDKITLFYYDDDVLCSEEDEIITDVDAAIGRRSLDRIGEFEEDVVYVRNERRSTDYEVIRQHRDFAEIPEEDDG